MSYAAQVLNQGHAQWFLVTNMAHVWKDPTKVYSARMSREAVEVGVPAQQILVAGLPVQTTYEEALVIRRFAEDVGWQSLIVITSPSHTRRARVIFRDVFHGSSITVMIRPMVGHWYTPDTWWKRRDGWRETLLEYTKLVLHWLGIGKQHQLPI